MTIGGEVTLSAPYAGSLWVSPSYIKVRNGWALANGGVEVMHSLGGAGIAANYMGLTNSTLNSTRHRIVAQSGLPLRELALHPPG